MARAWRWGRRVKPQRQLDSLDCGPCCLGMIAEFHGCDVGRHELREQCEQDRQGSSIVAIARAATQLGFRTQTVRASMRGLETAPTPCIAYLTRGHYVVVERVTSRKIWVADPAIGLVAFSHSEFAGHWLTGPGATGVLIMLAPGPDLKKNVRRPAFDYRHLLGSVSRLVRRNMWPFVAGALALLITQTSLPFLSAALVDRGILAQDVNVLYMVLIGQVALLLGRVTVELLQNSILAHLGAQLDTTLISQFLGKLSRLPFAFFANKSLADTLQRVEDHKVIEQTVTRTVGQLFFAVLSFVVFGAVLWVFSTSIFLLFAVGTALQLVWSGWFMNLLRRMNYSLFGLMAARHAVLHQYLSGLQEIKLNDAAEYYRSQWVGATNKANRANVRAQILGHVQQGGGTLVNEVKNILVVVAAAFEVMHGEMSLGTMVAVQFIMGQLNWPVSQLMTLVVRSGDAHMSLLRARDVHELDDEDAGRTAPLTCGDGAAIRIEDLSFRYRGTGRQDDVLKNVSLIIPAGKATAIVGRSGSGKSTLLRILLGMQAPDRGRILVGDDDLSKVPASQWRQRCGVVMQDGFVFSDSILNNITLGAEPDARRVADACRIARVDAFLSGLPRGLQTIIGMDGSGLSRGQLQRILIARALYRQPGYVFLDEATSALDAETEAQVSSALEEATRGRTAVVVAHRLSTIRAAHKIVVMENGAIVEEGDHATLIRKRGRYYDLVRHQLAAEETADVAAVVH